MSSLLNYIYVGFLSSLALASPDIPCQDAIKEMPGYVCYKEKKFAEGSYSVAYLVRKEETDEIFIMKVANIRWQTHNGLNKPDSEFLRLFKGSEYVIQMYEEKQLGEYLYEILEYAENGDLQDFVNFNPHFFDDYSEVLKFSLRLVRGLQEIHKKNVIHTDIKPQNIVVDKEHHPKYIDFNLSLGPHDSKTANARGDPRYNPPEVLFNRGKKHTWTADKDVFSLGLVLYYIYNKAMPFASISTNYFERAVKRKKYLLYKGTPKDYIKIVQGCLQEDPTARYALPVLEEMIVAAQVAKTPDRLDRRMLASLDSFELEEAPFVFINPQLLWIFIGIAIGVLSIIAIVLAFVFIKRRGGAPALHDTPNEFQTDYEY